MPTSTRLYIFGRMWASAPTKYTQYNVGASIARPLVQDHTAVTDGQWPPLQYKTRHPSGGEFVSFISP